MNNGAILIEKKVIFLEMHLMMSDFRKLRIYFFNCLYSRKKSRFQACNVTKNFFSVSNIELPLQIR